MHNLVPRARWLFDMKGGAFLPVKKPRDPGKKVAKYKQIDRTHFFLFGFFSFSAGEAGGYLFNSSLPFPLASQTLRY